MGLKQTIGVVLDNGDISIQRNYYKPGYREYTLVRGNDFELVCGKCGGMVFFKKGGRDDSDNRKSWVHSFALSTTVIKFGGTDNQNRQGTFIQQGGTV